MFKRRAPKTIKAIALVLALAVLMTSLPVAPAEAGWLPQLKLPQVKLPQVNLPKLPEVKLPNLGLPGVSLPQLPQLDLPGLKLPEFKMPDLKMPDVKMPELKLPTSFGGKGILDWANDINVPVTVLPGLRKMIVEFGDKLVTGTSPIKLPDLGLPTPKDLWDGLKKVKFPELPSLKLPESIGGKTIIDWANDLNIPISLLPGLGKMVLELGDNLLVTIPQIKLPHIEWPNISIPSLGLLPQILPFLSALPDSLGRTLLDVERELKVPIQLIPKFLGKMELDFFEDLNVKLELPKLPFNLQGAVFINPSYRIHVESGDKSFTVNGLIGGIPNLINFNGDLTPDLSVATNLIKFGDGPKGFFTPNLTIDRIITSPHKADLKIVAEYDVIDSKGLRIAIIKLGYKTSGDTGQAVGPVPESYQVCFPSLWELLGGSADNLKLRVLSRGVGGALRVLAGGKTSSDELLLDLRYMEMPSEVTFAAVTGKDKNQLTLTHNTSLKPVSLMGLVSLKGSLDLRATLLAERLPQEMSAEVLKDSFALTYNKAPHGRPFVAVSAFTGGQNPMDARVAAEGLAPYLYARYTNQGLLLEARSAKGGSLDRIGSLSFAVANYDQEKGVPIDLPSSCPEAEKSGSWISYRSSGPKYLAEGRIFGLRQVSGNLTGMSGQMPVPTIKLLTQDAGRLFVWAHTPEVRGSVAVSELPGTIEVGYKDNTFKAIYSEATAKPDFNVDFLTRNEEPVHGKVALKGLPPYVEVAMAGENINITTKSAPDGELEPLDLVEFAIANYDQQGTAPSLPPACSDTSGSYLSYRSNGPKYLAEGKLAGLKRISGNVAPPAGAELPMPSLVLDTVNVGLFRVWVNMPDTRADLAIDDLPDHLAMGYENNRISVSYSGAAVRPNVDVAFFNRTVEPGTGQAAITHGKLGIDALPPYLEAGLADDNIYVETKSARDGSLESVASVSLAVANYDQDGTPPNLPPPCPDQTGSWLSYRSNNNQYLIEGQVLGAKRVAGDFTAQSGGEPGAIPIPEIDIETQNAGRLLVWAHTPDVRGSLTISELPGKMSISYAADTIRASYAQAASRPNVDLDFFTRSTDPATGKETMTDGRISVQALPPYLEVKMLEGEYSIQTKTSPTGNLEPANSVNLSVANFDRNQPPSLPPECPDKGANWLSYRTNDDKFLAEGRFFKVKKVTLDPDPDDNPDTPDTVPMVEIQTQNPGRAVIWVQMRSPESISDGRFDIPSVPDVLRILPNVGSQAGEMGIRMEVSSPLDLRGSLKWGDPWVLNTVIPQKGHPPAPPASGLTAYVANAGSKQASIINLALPLTSVGIIKAGMVNNRVNAQISLPGPGWLGKGYVLQEGFDAAGTKMESKIFLDIPNVPDVFNVNADMTTQDRVYLNGSMSQRLPQITAGMVQGTNDVTLIIKNIPTSWTLAAALLGLTSPPGGGGGGGGGAPPPSGGVTFSIDGVDADITLDYSNQGADRIDLVTDFGQAQALRIRGRQGAASNLKRINFDIKVKILGMRVYLDQWYDTALGRFDAKLDINKARNLDIRLVGTNVPEARFRHNVLHFDIWKNGGDKFELFTDFYVYYHYLRIRWKTLWWWTTLYERTTRNRDVPVDIIRCGSKGTDHPWVDYAVVQGGTNSFEGALDLLYTDAEQTGGSFGEGHVGLVLWDSVIHNQGLGNVQFPGDMN